MDITQPSQSELNARLRHLLTFLNRFFMVPLFRLGLGGWVGSPPAGYIMVLKTVGRKTGKQRYAPVNYALAGGDIYCVAGFGRVSDWYRNLRTNPRVEVILPGGTVTGVAEEVRDPDVALRLTRKIYTNAGFAGFIYGFNPARVPDERIREVTGDAPLIRIHPDGVGSGPADPGGYFWVVSTAVMLWWIVRRRKRD